ncbi:AAA-ATPase-like domain-containing protein [Mycena kentingensis (nom. inval.)]|nr:AAA-ATPase-like domain-containing protein [Mycena kentingensis (nom. inval.)]
MVVLTSSLPKPLLADVPTLSYKALHISHPGYKHRPIFLRLTAYLVDQTCCFPLRSALDAASIMANNLDGYLAILDQTKNPPYSRIDSDDPAALLPAGEYFYFTLDFEQNPQYAICRSFKAWSPRYTLPPHWNLTWTQEPAHSSSWSAVSLCVPVKDGACLQTKETSRLHASHLLPRAEEPWWQYHHFDSFIRGNTAGINQWSNIITLRADLNAMGMDEGHFVFVPHAGQITTIFLTDKTPDLAHTYHLQAVELPARIHPQCLFGRFAWNIFKANQGSLPGFFDTADIISIEVPSFDSTMAVQRMLMNSPQSKKRARSDSGGSVSGGAASGSGASGTAGRQLQDAGSEASQDEESVASSLLESNPMDLARRFSEKDYEVAAAQEAEAIRLGRLNDDVYPGSTAILRLKNEYLHRACVIVVENADIGGFVCRTKEAILRVQLGHDNTRKCLKLRKGREDFVVLAENGIHEVSVDFCGCYHTMDFDLCDTRGAFIRTTMSSPVTTIMPPRIERSELPRFSPSSLVLASSTTGLALLPNPATTCDPERNWRSVTSSVMPQFDTNYVQFRASPTLAYVDKTAYVLTLPPNFKYILLRPRRFGKTTFLSTLHDLYDIRAIDVPSSHLCPPRREHLCLRFRFHYLAESSDIRTVSRAIRSAVTSALRNFLRVYSADLGIRVDGPMVGEGGLLLSRVLEHVRARGMTLFVSVDDFDAPLRPLRHYPFIYCPSISHPPASGKEIADIMAEEFWNPLRAGYEVVPKLIVAGCVLPQTSLARLMDLVTSPQLDLVCGFTIQEAKDLGTHILGPVLGPECVAAVQEKYCFAGTAPPTLVLHPQQVLHAIHKTLVKDFYSDDVSFDLLSLALDLVSHSSIGLEREDLISLVSCLGVHVPYPEDAFVDMDRKLPTWTALHDLGALTRDPQNWTTLHLRDSART